MDRTEDGSDDRRSADTRPERATQTVERECTRCDWFAVADSYSALTERYQDHLRAEHPDLWLRT